MVEKRAFVACLVGCIACLCACSDEGKETIAQVVPTSDLNAAVPTIRDYVLPYCEDFKSQSIPQTSSGRVVVIQALDTQFVLTPIGELLNESIQPTLQASRCVLPNTVEVDFGSGFSRHFILEPLDQGFLQYPMAFQMSQDLSENFDIQVCLKPGATLKHALFLDGHALNRVQENSHCFLLPNADLLDPKSEKGDLSGFFESNKNLLTAAVPGLGGTQITSRIAVMNTCKNVFDSLGALTCEDNIIDEFGRRCMRDMRQAPLGEIIHWSSCNLLHRIVASECRSSPNQTAVQLAEKLKPLLTKECDKLPLLYPTIFL
ncbi:MAG: hypothetical protein AAF310_04505 [Myxococcota bacterium]